MEEKPPPPSAGLIKSVQSQLYEEQREMIPAELNGRIV